VHQFPIDKVRDISMKVLQWNTYFAHSESETHILHIQKM